MMRLSTVSSVEGSSDEVASSKMQILPFDSKARAMAMRCACPSESPSPCSPQMVSSPFAFLNTKSAAAMCSACLMSSSVALGLPCSRFERIVPENSVFP